MVLKNLLRRRGRTILAVLGISIGVAAIIVLGALADGLEAGYGAVMSGSKADLILSDPEAYDIIMSAVDEDIGETIGAMPEVEDISGMMQGLVKAENMPYFFVFGYPEGSFALGSFRVVEGVGLYSYEAEQMRGTPLLLGSAASEALSKKVGDTLRLGDTPFRVVGIYETGQAFEEGGAVLRMEDAQEVVGMPRQVSAFYIKLKDPTLAERLRTRVERIYPDLSLSTAEDMAKQTSMADEMRAMMGGVAALAILIGGVGMMNSQLMAVLERTREIGVLRAVGWRGGRVMLMILGESVVVGLVGGLLGTGLSWLILYTTGSALSVFGTTTEVHPELLVQAFAVVFTLGLVGGLYPAYRASRLQPVEALRYEGGSLGQQASRLPVGGMAIQNLWRRKGRTLLTLGMIGITVGAIMALNALLKGLFGMMSDLTGGAEVVLREADTADTGLSAIDERIGDRIAAMPEVENVSGLLMTAIATEDTGIFLLLGYNPREAAIQEFHVVEGERLTSNRQIMIGRKMADAQGFKATRSR
jgi:putative ABC transport system permease protein